MIYLDHNATTAVHPNVVSAMLPFFSENFGNPASAHAVGWSALSAVQAARSEIARLIGATESESITFTSGTTESNNLAIRGVVAASGKSAAHIITQATEHACVLASCAELERAGHQVTILPVNAQGHIDLQEFSQSFRPNTILVSIMHANNEIGTIHDIKTLVEITHQNQALFHTDAAQSLGKIPFSVSDLDVDLVSFSAHKIYGPKGIGALYTSPRRRAIHLHPLIFGGGHENGLRSGTLNVPGIIGLAKCLEITTAQLSSEGARLKTLRDQLWQNLQKAIPGLTINGDYQNRLPGNLNLTIPHIKATDLITVLPELAFSTGSACAANTTEPSHVLQALGLSRVQAEASIRIGLGSSNTEAEILIAAQRLIQAIETLQKLSLTWQMENDAKS